MKELYNKIKLLCWAVFSSVKIFLIKRKCKKLNQCSRVNLYKEFPPLQGDVGIGYKNRRLYDYLYKEYI